MVNLISLDNWIAYLYEIWLEAKLDDNEANNMMESLAKPVLCDGGKCNLPFWMQ